jgi:hypothetical protein
MNNLENFSNWLQIFSFLILIEDFNNTDLMQYLEHQDNLLNEIINQNKEILQLLKEGGKNGH